MEIRPISNNQPHFNGYVDKSVRKYVHKAIKNECKKIYNTNEFNNEPEKQNKMAELHYIGSKILNKLSAYMKSTHKNTKFTMGNTRYESYPRFQNPISDHIVRIYSPLTNKAPYMDECGEIAMPKTPVLNPKKDARLSDLNTLYKYAENLEKIDPKKIDMAFYDAEKEKLRETKGNNFGLISEIRKIFHEENVESFYAKIHEKID